MNFDFILFSGSYVFFPDHALEGIGRRDAVDGNEDAFGEARCDTSDSGDDNGTHFRYDRGVLSEEEINSVRVEAEKLNS